MPVRVYVYTYIISCTVIKGTFARGDIRARKGGESSKPPLSVTGLFVGGLTSQSSLSSTSYACPASSRVYNII